MTAVTKRPGEFSQGTALSKPRDIEKVRAIHRVIRDGGNYREAGDAVGMSAQGARQLYLRWKPKPKHIDNPAKDTSDKRKPHAWTGKRRPLLAHERKRGPRFNEWVNS